MGSRSEATRRSQGKACMHKVAGWLHQLVHSGTCLHHSCISDDSGSSGSSR